MLVPGVVASQAPAAGGGGLVTPDQIADLEYWIDLTDSTITETSGEVSQINDLSGNGNHVTPANGAGNRGTLEASQFGARDGLLYDGSSLGPPYSAAAVNIDGTAGTFFIVFRVPALASDRYPIGFGGFDDEQGASLQIRTGGGLRMNISDGSTMVQVTAASAYGINETVIGVGAWDSGNIFVHCNGVEDSDTHSHTDYGVDDAAWIGAVFASGSVVGAAGFYSRMLDAGEIDNLIAYLESLYPTS